jgi:hypothetical protein
MLSNGGSILDFFCVTSVFVDLVHSIEASFSVFNGVSGRGRLLDEAVLADS